MPKARARMGPGSELALTDFGTVVLGHCIGEGGMGVVYRGWLYYDPAGRLGGTPAHPVAVKVLHPLIRGRARAEQLFRHEAEVLARLSHPNVVHCFGLFEHQHELCILMELVQGESLSELLARAEALAPRPPRLPFKQAWQMLAQLLGALSSIHALGIVHRDVKSANVLVRSDGIVKLTDFGIARLPAELSRQSGGIAPGTGAYMAPEQVMNTPLDPRADLYAAAIVMFEMLTGATPFDSPEKSEMAVRAAQLDEAAPPISQLVPGAPAALDLVFARALAKHRDLRYDDARALGEAFRTALGQPDSPGWQAQAELSQVAHTLSMAMAALLEPSASHEPSQSPALPTTEPIPDEEPPAWSRQGLPPADEPSLLATEAKAERYRSDVMAAFKRE